MAVSQHALGEAAVATMRVKDGVSDRTLNRPCLKKRVRLVEMFECSLLLLIIVEILNFVFVCFTQKKFTFVVK